MRRHNPFLVDEVDEEAPSQRRRRLTTPTPPGSPPPPLSSAPPRGRPPRNASANGAMPPVLPQRPKATVTKAAAQILNAHIPTLLSDSSARMTFVTLIFPINATKEENWSKVISVLPRLEALVMAIPGVLAAFIAVETHPGSKPKKAKPTLAIPGQPHLTVIQRPQSDDDSTGENIEEERGSSPSRLHWDREVQSRRRSLLPPTVTPAETNMPAIAMESLIAPLVRDTTLPRSPPPARSSSPSSLPHSRRRLFQRASSPDIQPEEGALEEFLEDSIPPPFPQLSRSAAPAPPINDVIAPIVPATPDPAPAPQSRDKNSRKDHPHVHIVIIHSLLMENPPDYYFSQRQLLPHFPDVHLAPPPKKGGPKKAKSTVGLVRYVLKGDKCQLTLNNLRPHLPSAAPPLPSSTFLTHRLVRNEKNLSPALRERLGCFEKALRDPLAGPIILSTLADGQLPQSSVAPPGKPEEKGIGLYYSSVESFMRRHRLFLHPNGIFQIKPQALWTLVHCMTHDAFITSLASMDGQKSAWATYSEKLRLHMPLCPPIFPLAKINYDLVELKTGIFRISTHDFLPLPAPPAPAAKDALYFDVPPVLSEGFCFVHFDLPAEPPGLPRLWLNILHAQNWPAYTLDDFVKLYAKLFRHPRKRKDRNMYLSGASDCGKSTVLQPLERFFSSADIARLNSGNFSSSYCIGKRIAIVEEYDVKWMSYSDFLLWTEGGRDIMLQQKSKNTVPTPVNYPIVFSSGNRPFYAADNGSVANRLYYFDFTVSIPPHLIDVTYREKVEAESFAVLYFCNRKFLNK